MFLPKCSSRIRTFNILLFLVSDMENMDLVEVLAIKENLGNLEKLNLTEKLDDTEKLNLLENEDEKAKMDIDIENGVIRAQRTQEYALNVYLNNQDAIRDPNFSYRSHVFTSRFICSCKDCIQYSFNKPLQCVDPYIIDMRYTHWVYYGLVAASKTESAHTPTEPQSDEPKAKRAKR